MNSRDIVPEERHVLAVLSSERFLRMEGLGNEIPFFIWAYPPQQELEVREAHRRILSVLRSEHGLNVQAVDLFDLSITLLEERGWGMLDRLEGLEPTRSKSDFRRDLQRMLDPEKHIVPAIKQQIDGKADLDILVLTGIGRVFPFIRSHNILNNLQRAASRIPVLTLFPGEYRQSVTMGSSLVLFDRLTDDQYYRAKNIMEQEPA